MTLKTSFRKALRDSKNLSFIQKCLAFYMVNLMQKKAKHSKLLKVFKICAFFRQKIVYFYQAEFNYYHSKYDISIECIDYFLKFYPKHIEGKYLKAQLLLSLNKKKESWDILIECLNSTKRLKTWLFLSKIAQNQDDNVRLERLCLQYIQNYSQQEQMIIRGYLISAFKKNYDYTRAKEYIKKNIMDYPLETVSKKNKMIKQDAIDALRDIKKILDNIGINFFLVSGTFLGCIRDSDFIGYDYDIDIGIWSEDYSDKVKNEILEYGVFIQYDLNWIGGLKLKHANGVKIDVFLHFKEYDKIYHQGEVVKWYNTTFKLQKYNFIGDEYYGFKDFDKYLSENYGDWKIRKMDFDNILDTPNAVIINKDVFVVHLYQLLMSRYARKNKNKILTHLKELEEKI